MSHDPIYHKPTTFKSIQQIKSQMAIKCDSSSQLTLLILTILLAQKTPHAVDLCQETDYEPLCRSIIGNTTNPVDATEVSIKSLISETTQVKEQAQKTGNESPELDVCYEEFGDAIDELNEALKYLVNRDKDTISNYLSAAVTDYVTCDDAYADSNKISPLAQNTTLLTQMATNCLSLAIQIP